MDKKIPQAHIEKIIESGVWGFSILGTQPWKIVSTDSKKMISAIANISLLRSGKVENPLKTILKSTSKTLSSANFLICVYMDKTLMEKAGKYKNFSNLKIERAIVQVIGGVVQNMILTASSLGVASVWIDSPIFYDEDKINNLLSQRKCLIAMIAFGYPQRQLKRSKRKPYAEIVEYIK